MKKSAVVIGRASKEGKVVEAGHLLQCQAAQKGKRVTSGLRYLINKEEKRRSTGSQSGKTGAGQGPDLLGVLARALRIIRDAADQRTQARLTRDGMEATI